MKTKLLLVALLATVIRIDLVSEEGPPLESKGSEIDADAQPGLVGEYFRWRGLNALPNVVENRKPIYVRIDRQINFGNAGGEFHGTKMADDIYGRWTGLLRIRTEDHQTIEELEGKAKDNAEGKVPTGGLKAPGTPSVLKPGSYTFFISSDDGSRLTIGNKLVVNNDGIHGMVEKSGRINLSGGDHPIKIEFFEKSGGAGVKVSWTFPGGRKHTLPASVIFHKKGSEQIEWNAVAWKKMKKPRSGGRGGQTFLKPEKAGPDHRVQGEYTGKVGGKKYGVHVIALGDGGFNAVFYPGGLPGDGWDGDKKNRIRLQGETGEGDKAPTNLSGKEWNMKIENGIMTVTSKKSDKALGELNRIVRKSETLGMKPPAGAVVLFDGTNVDQWKGGRMTEDGLLMESTTSKPKFQNCTIHIEFMTPFKPHARGQGRGNSGFYAQGRYEVQVLDSFGLEGNHNECGGIYSVGPPSVNMCYPPLTWQTYDVDFTTAQFDQNGKKIKNARMTVRHNGVVTHKDQEIDHRTIASPLREGPEPGPVYFQGHGNPVRFRNIWVLPKK